MVSPLLQYTRGEGEHRVRDGVRGNEGRGEGRGDEREREREREKERNIICT